MELSNQDIIKIMQVVSESHYAEFRLEDGDFKLYLRADGVTTGIIPGGLPVDIGNMSTGMGAGAPENTASSLSLATLTPQEVPAAAAPRSAEIGSANAASIKAIKAPMTGTVYLSPAPGEPHFVTLGKHIDVDDAVCIVEVMKLFNSIAAGVTGKVHRICVEDGTMVNEGQLLMEVDTGTA